MADLSLSFGVLGGGKLSGESAHEILKDLQSICSNISRSKLLKVSVHLDNKTIYGGLQKEIESINLNKLKLNTEKLKLKFGIDTKYLDDQLKEVYKNYKPPSDNSGSSKKKSSQTTSKEYIKQAIAEAREIAKLEAQLTGRDGSSLDAVLNQQIASHKASLNLIRQSIEGIEDESERQRLLNKLLEEENNLAEKIARAKAKAKDKGSDQSGIGQVYKDAAVYMERYGTLLAKNSPELYRQLSELITKLGSGTFSGNSNDAIRALDGIKGKAAETGATVEKLGQKMTRIFNDKYVYGVMATLAMSARRVFTTLFRNVVEVDTAMTELKKVTQETDATYDRFLKTAASRTKGLGATLTDVVTATADFARLGYNLADASTLADTAIVYKNVGDGISDISAASESIISTMQAFGIEATNAMSIVDKFNNVGNNFAISSKGIGDALVRSAAALHAGGNTLDESIALITAANQVVQNPDSVGTAMKTISMYLRAAKTEAEEAGESTDGMANSVSELREEILALTGNKVDIMLDDETFKSTYQIMQEMSKVWGELTDVSKANILEMLGGKRNANIIAALLENFEKAEEVLETSSKSAGSALQENEKYLDSINGKVNILKGSIQALSTGVLDNELAKSIVDIANGLVNALIKFEDTSSLAPFLALLPFLRSLTDSFFKARAASTGFLQTLGRMFASAGVLGQIGLIIAAVTTLVALIDAIPGVDIAGWFKKWTSSATERISTLNSELETTMQTMQETVDKTKQMKGSLEDIIPKYMELYEKAGSFGDQGDLSNEEYQEFINLQNQLAELLPQLDAGLDSNGNHILALSGNVEEATEKLWGFYEVQKAINAQEIKNKFGDALSTYSEVKETASSGITDLENEIAELKETYDKLLSGDILLGNKRVVAEEQFGITAIDEYGFVNPDAIDEDAIAKIYQTKIDAIHAKIASYNRERANSSSILSSFFPYLLESDATYQEIDDATKSLIEPIITALDADEIYEKLSKDGPVTEKAITDYLFDAYVNPIQDADLGENVSKVLARELTFDEALSNLTGAFDDVDEAVKTKFVSAMNELGYEGKDANAVLESLLKTMTAVEKAPPQELDLGLGEIQSALVKTRTEFEVLDDILAKFQASGFSGLNSDEFEELIKILPGIRTEMQNYVQAVADGNDPLAEQRKLLKSLTTAAQQFKTTKLAEAIDDVAKAAEDYGKDSGQVQDAMQELAQICPEVAAAVWNEADALYDLSGAAGTSAQAIHSFLLATLNSNFASLISELDTLKAKYYEAGAAAIWAAATLGNGPYVGKKAGEVGPDHEANIDEYVTKETRSYEDTVKALNDAFASLKVPSGGGGGSSKTPADNLKEAYDDLAASLEYQIQVQEQAFTQAKENLDSQDMREALIRQVGYYRAIQTQAEKSLEAIKEYYRAQGMSESQIELQEPVQDLSDAWIEASQNVDEALERMSSAITEAFSQSVDEIQGVYTTLHNAADEFASSGFITVDTFQEIIAHGVEYLALLQDENGQLVINEESIKAIIAARTEQMAIESALAYVEALRSAKLMGNLEEMDRLLNATNEASDATWGLVYATLNLVGLEEGQYDAALNVIDAIRSLSNTAIESIGKTSKGASDALKEMKTGIDDVLDYTMDMIKQEIDDQIDAIEDAKDAYSDYIEMRKEALETMRDENDYDEQKAELLKDIAKLQNNIDSLNLVGTRESEAEKAKLLEEQRELQKELADLQGEYAYDAQIEALDKMEEAYNDEKDREIKKLEESVSSQEKLYQEAISRIETQWDSLYDQLIAWNTESGNSLNSEITSAWEQALAAAKKYGSYTAAMNNIQADIDGIGNNPNISLGNKNQDHTSTDDDHIRSIVTTMKANSDNWHSIPEHERSRVAAENQKLGAQLEQYGVKAVYDPQTGIWYVDHIGGTQLYKKYAYHSGGVVGGGTVKQNEQFALLEKGETVFTEKTVNKLGNQFKILGKLGNIMTAFAKSYTSSLSGVVDKISANRADISQAAKRDDRKINITFGDTIIQGANSETIRKHQEVNKQFMDELARQLGAKW